MVIKIFSFSFTLTSCQHSYGLFIVFDFIRCLRIMWLLSVVEIQYNDRYVRIGAMKIISLRI